ASAEHARGRQQDAALWYAGHVHLQRGERRGDGDRSRALPQGLRLGPDQEGREAPRIPPGRRGPRAGDDHAHQLEPTETFRKAYAALCSTAGSELSCGSAAAEEIRLSKDTRAISATASRTCSSLQPASRASSTRCCSGRPSSVSRTRASSAASFSSEEVNSRARATSSRPRPATFAVRAYWERV